MATNSHTAPGKTIQHNRLLRPILGIPVFYKVLIANSFIIFVGATGGTWLASGLNTTPQVPIFLMAFVTIGWLLSLSVYFVVLQVAFRPLHCFGKVMKCVQQGV